MRHVDFIMGLVTAAAVVFVVVLTVGADACTFMVSEEGVVEMTMADVLRCQESGGVSFIVPDGWMPDDTIRVHVATYD